MAEQFTSAFDANSFLDAQQTEPNVKRPPLPAENPDRPDGTYAAVIKSVKMVTGTIEKGDRTGEPWLQALVTLSIDVPQVLQDSLKLPSAVTLSDGVFIDLTPQRTIDNGAGRNRRQRIYRDALDLNKPGDIWSWRKAEGQPIRLKINHELYNGEVVERPGALFHI